MKSSIKITAVILSLTLAILSFSACSLKKNDDNKTTTTTTATETTAESITKESETTTTQSTTTQLAIKDEIISTENVLKLIKNFPLGTAGSTAKCIDIALNLLNFSQQDIKAEELQEECQSFYGKLSAREKMMFEENLGEIDAAARGLIDEKSSLEKYAEDSGVKYDKGNYNLKKYEAVYNIISNI